MAAQRSTVPVVRALSKTGLTPNTLTLLGFLWSLAAAVVIAKEYLFLAGLLVLFSGAFDLFDGALARAKGQGTKFGAFLDSTLDRLSEAALLCGLLVLYATQPSTLEIWLIFITLIGSASVSYVRARAEGLGMKCEVGIFTRPERVIVLALGLLLNGVVIALWIMATLTLVTLVQRIIYVWQQTREELKTLPQEEEVKNYER
jgi:CDP-diacylglycerol--glycerol-3-phosphate 3-phosphatidyltransferase